MTLWVGGEEKNEANLDSGSRRGGKGAAEREQRRWVEQASWCVVVLCRNGRRQEGRLPLSSAALIIQAILNTKDESFFRNVHRVILNTSYP